MPNIQIFCCDTASGEALGLATKIIFPNEREAKEYVRLGGVLYCPENCELQYRAVENTPLQHKFKPTDTSKPAGYWTSCGLIALKLGYYFYFFDPKNGFKEVAEPRKWSKERPIFFHKTQEKGHFLVSHYPEFIKEGEKLFIKLTDNVSVDINMPYFDTYLSDLIKISFPFDKEREEIKERNPESNPIVPAQIIEQWRGKTSAYLTKQAEVWAKKESWLKKRREIEKYLLTKAEFVFEQVVQQGEKVEIAGWGYDDEIGRDVWKTTSTNQYIGGIPVLWGWCGSGCEVDGKKGAPLYVMDYVDIPESLDTEEKAEEHFKKLGYVIVSRYNPTAGMQWPFVMKRY